VDGGRGSDDAAARPRRPPPSGERRLLPALTILVIVLVPFLLPEHLRSWTRWVLGALEVALLIALIAVDPGRIDRRGGLARGLSIALIALLVLAAAVATVTLVVDLVSGDVSFKQPGPLLVTGGLVWLDANLTFALLYWELDGGGPAQRLHEPNKHPDLAFPQHVNPDLARPDWRPTFLDYLYLGLTNALAFSPTDVMPLTHWAKLTMAVQSIISLLILTLVIANAVNLLN
jgi:uncharacterized membrane protein